MPTLPTMRALLGLGNPGPDYRLSRHNLGFMVLDRLADRAGLRIREEPGGIEAGGWRPRGSRREILLVKPCTFMNHSGRAVEWLRERRGIAGEELLVVLDDIDLPFGRLRLRPSGGAGTHNGLRSVIASAGHGEFPRLRVGIGPAPENEDLSDWVLEDLSSDEQKSLPEVLDLAVDCLSSAARDGIDLAMNRFNQR